MAEETKKIAEETTPEVVVSDVTVRETPQPEAENLPQSPEKDAAPVTGESKVEDEKEKELVGESNSFKEESNKVEELPQEYQVSCIPGALFFDIDGITDRTTNLPHMLPSEEAFAAAVSALDIKNKDGVVIYDGKGIFSAARVWWMFRAFGHDKVWVLDGGLPRWRASGYDVESPGDAILKASAATEAIEKVYQGQMVGPSTFQTKFQLHLVWSLDQVKRNIQDQTYQHIDARSKARFDGVAPEPRKGINSGHVPGSKCIPFPQMLDGSQTLLSREELEKKFGQEGISLDKPIVASCGTGVTACILVLGLHRLGKTDIPVYDGSWTEWATQPDTPLCTAER